MSTIVGSNTDMEKLPSVFIDVKHKHPDNVIEYDRIEFEVYSTDSIFKAVPLISMHTRLLTNLPGQLLFEVKNGKIINYNVGKEDVIKNIVNELKKLDVIDMPDKICMNDCSSCTPKTGEHS